MEVGNQYVICRIQYGRSTESAWRRTIYPIPEIDKLLELQDIYITQIAALLQEYPDDTDVQIAARYLKTAAQP